MVDKNNNLESVETTYSKLCNMKKLQIKIPKYNCTYKWPTETLQKFLKDLFSFYQNTNKDRDYLIGNIVLYSDPGNNGKTEYDVVDGVHRICVLYTLLFYITEGNAFSLKTESSFKNTKLLQKSVNIIKDFVDNHKNESKDFYSFLQTHITFYCIKINSETQDLAFNFITNNSTKGIHPSAFDQLKAHHLRFYSLTNEDEEKQKSNAKKWDEYSENNYITQTLGLYLYRIRQWLYAKPVTDKAQEKNRYYNEFESKGFISNYTGFQISRCESAILGGQFFFEYALYYIDRMDKFKSKDCIKKLTGTYDYCAKSTKSIIDVIEAITFFFYIRFCTDVNDYLLNKAVVKIAQVVEKWREENDRFENSFYNCEYILKLVRMIHQNQFAEIFIEQCGKYLDDLGGPTAQKNIDKSPIKKEVHSIVKSLLQKNYKSDNEQQLGISR